MPAQGGEGMRRALILPTVTILLLPEKEFLELMRGQG